MIGYNTRDVSNARAIQGPVSPACSRVLFRPESSGRFSFYSGSWGSTTRSSGGMSDRTLTCRDCGQTFTFTAGEQAFYQERGFSEPTRCKACRDKRKVERNASGGGGYDSYGGSSYGGNSYGGGGGYGSSGRDYNSAPRQMYPA